MKRIISILLSVVITMSIIVLPASATGTADVWDGTTIATGFAGGTGTADDPYEIATAPQLAYLAKTMWDAYSQGTESGIIDSTGERSTTEKPLYNAYTGKYFKLTADIDLNNKEWTPIGSYAVRFNGNFDGNGHIVSNLKITKDYLGMGLFGATGYAASISKLGVQTASISFTNAGGTSMVDYTKTGISYNDRIYGAGALIGLIGGGTVKNCYAKSVTISKSNQRGANGGSGGLIGSGNAIEKYDGTVNVKNAASVENSYVKDVTISVYDRVGAFIGDAAVSSGSSIKSDISFKNCYAGGTVSLSGATTAKFGNCSHGSGTATTSSYSVVASQTAGWRSFSVTTAATATEMSTALVDNGNYFADTNINGGWPVLPWELGIEVWDGTVAAKFDGGTGTKDDPYKIANAPQLAYLAKTMWDAYAQGTDSSIISSTGERSTDAKPLYNAYTGVYFELTADIDLSSKEWTPIGSYAVRFNGNFNGNGHTVSNLKMTNPYLGIGLFGATGYASSISKLGLKDVSITFSNDSGTAIKDYINTGISYNDRIYGAGALVGVLGGGTVENCFAKNVSITKTGSRAMNGATGGLLGTGNAIENYTGTVNTSNVTYVKNCYVTGVTISVMNNCAPFIGDTGQSNTAAGRCDVVISKCYAGGDISLTGSGKHRFGRKDTTSYASGKTPMTDCYTTYECTHGDSRYFAATVVADAGAMCDALVDNSNFYYDNEVVPVNNGWPVLAWESRYWLNDVQTDILSTYFLNKITKGQSKDYLLNNIDLFTEFTHDGKQYKVEWNTSNTAIISNSGKVSHAAEAKTVDAKAYVYDVAEDKFATEIITFGVTPSGAEIFTSSFDGTDFANWTGDSAVFENGASISAMADDTLLKITDNADGTASEFTRTFTEFTDGVINTMFSVYADSSFTGASVKLGGTVVTLTPTTIKAGGTETTLTQALPENKWVPVHIVTDINNDTVTAAVGTDTVTETAVIDSVSAVSIVESGNALIDEVLVYESVPGELDELTYDTILNGQNRFMVTDDLYLPEEIPFHRGTINVKWSSSDTDAVATDGTIGNLDITKTVTLSASAYEDDPADVLEVKTFEVYISSKGSTLLFSDDFETATQGQKVSSYNEWSVGNESYTRWTIEKDPAASATATFDESNKVMSIDRFIDTTINNGVAPGGEITTHDVVNVDDGLIEFSFDMYLTNLAQAPQFEICYGKQAFVAELYMAEKQGWFSGASVVAPEGAGSRVNWKFKKNTWQNWRIIMNTAEKTLTVYVDGVKCKEISRYTQVNDTTTMISISSERHSDPATPWYIDNLIVRNLMPETDTKTVELASEWIEIPDTVSSDITLPYEGEYNTGIWWSSSDTSVITNDGKVNGSSDEQTVTLTAHIYKGDAVYSRDFEVTVPASETVTATQEIVNGIAKNLPFGAISDESQFYVTENLDLISEYTEGDAGRIGGVDITWSGFDETISEDGTITQGDTDKCVTLTATVTAGGFSATKKFKVSVPQKNCKSVIAEDFENYDDSLIGNDIDDASDDWTVTAPTSGISTVKSKLLRDPYDAENNVLTVKRKAFKNASEEPATFNASMEASDILMSTTFMLCSKFDVINLKVKGINQSIAIKKSAITVGGIDFTASLNVNEWYKLTVYYDGVNRVYDVYLDDVKLTSAPIAFDGDCKIEGIDVSSLAGDRGGCTWFVDDIMIRDVSLTDEEAVNAALKEIELETDVIEWNIENLPSVGRYGTTILWQSSNTNVLTNDGIVYRKVGEAYDLVLTATAIKNSASADKSFDLTIPALTADYTPPQDVFQKHMDEIPFSYFTDENQQRITKKINLKTEYNEGNAQFYGGADISWSSNRPNVIDNEGNVIRQVFDVPVTLTATFTSKRNPDIKYTKNYKVAVWAEGELIQLTDFEDTPAEWEKQIVDQVDPDHFKIDVAIETGKGQNTYFSKDVLDASKSWEEANKVVCVDRYKAPSGSPQRCTYYFDTRITAPNSYAFSFDYMMDTSESVAAITFDTEAYMLRFQSTALAGKGTTFVPRRWYTITVVYMQQTGVLDILIDGAKYFSGYIGYSYAPTITGIQFDIDRQSRVCKFYLDNIVVRKLTSDDAAIVAAQADSLTFDETILMENLNLPFTGDNRTMISYRSSNPDVLTDNGEVIRPVEGDANVDLTAYVSRGGAVAQKTFSFIVKQADGTAPFAVNSISGSDKKFTSVNVTKSSSYSGTSKLIVAAYDQNKLVQTRCVDISDMTAGTLEVPITEMDLTDNEYYRVVAYVMDENSVISNKKVISY